MQYSHDVLEELHGVLAEILEAVVTVCEQNNITYFLAEGTLLGAVRHHDIIPWDDDVDIAVPRADYDRLLKILPEALPNQYYLHCAENDRHYWLPFAKVRKKNTAFHEEDCVGLPDKEKQQIFIDIFPLDECEDITVAKKQRFLLQRVSQLGYVKCCRIKTVPFRYYYSKLIPMRLLHWLQKRISTFQKNGTHFICFGSAYDEKRHFIPKEKYLPAQREVFRGKMYCVPADKDFVLRTVYGKDYMKLPPKENRINHRPLYISFDATK